MNLYQSGWGLPIAKKSSQCTKDYLKMDCSSKLETQSQSFWKKTCAFQVGKDFLGRKHNAPTKEKTSHHLNPPLKNWVVLQFKAYWPVAAPYAGEGKKGLRSFQDSWSFTRDTKGLKGRGRKKNPLDLGTINLPKKKMRDKYSTCKSLVKKKEENHRTC